jgi:hypothetical protein
MLVLVETGVLMLMVDLLNLLIHFSSYLSSRLLVSYHFMVACEDSLLFCKCCHNG